MSQSDNEAPPSYSKATGSKTPLLSPVSGINDGDSDSIESKGSCCSRKCMISIIILLLMTTITIGAVFGTMASHCSGLTLQDIRDYESTFYGSQTKVIDLENTGDLTILAVPSVGGGTGDIYGKVSVAAKIFAANSKAADRVSVDEEITQSMFSLVFYPGGLLGCGSTQDLTLKITDGTSDGKTALDEFPLHELKAKSHRGKIDLDEFLHVTFTKAEVETEAGDVVSGKITVQDKLKLSTKSGTVKSDGANVGTADFKSSHGDLYVTDLVAFKEVKVKSDNGLISLQGLEVTANNATDSGVKCKVEVSSGGGAIYVDAATLPTTVKCDIKIQTSSGNIEIHFKNFVGTYSAEVTGGSVTVDGTQCMTTTCQGTIVGEGVAAHKLSIKTAKGSAVLVTSF